MGKLFTISGTDTIVADAQNTRGGFRHVVTYYRNGSIIASAKANYVNRTWEGYQFESAISKLLDKMGLSGAKKAHVLGVCNPYKKKDPFNPFQGGF